MFTAAVLASIISFSMVTMAPAAGRQWLKCYIVPREDLLHPVGRMPPGTVLHLAIGIAVPHPAAVDQWVQRVNDPKSTDYKHFLSPQEFTRRFGPAKEDYDRVIAFFKRRGFIITTYPNRTLLDIDGTVRMIEKTFHTTLRLYKHPSENRDFYAPDEKPSLDLDIPLSNIAGLDNFILFHPILPKVPAKSAAF